MTKSSLILLEHFGLVIPRQGQYSLDIPLCFLSAFLMLSSLYESKTIWTSLELQPALAMIDVKATAKSWNVFTGGSSFFKGIFLTNAMKSITMASVCGETAGPFSSKNGHNLSSWIPN